MWFAVILQAKSHIFSFIAKGIKILLKNQKSIKKSIKFLMILFIYQKMEKLNFGTPQFMKPKNVGLMFFSMEPEQ